MYSGIALNKGMVDLNAQRDVDGWDGGLAVLYYVVGWVLVGAGDLSLAVGDGVRCWLCGGGGERMRIRRAREGDRTCMNRRR